MSDEVKIIHQHSSSDGRRTTIVLEKDGSSYDSGPPLTGADLWRLEVRARWSYAMMVLLSSISTSWVYFFGGWKVLVLVPLFALFITFLETPEIRSKDWIMRNLFASKDNDIEQWQKSRSLMNQSFDIFVFFAAFVPFILMIYLIVRH